MSIGKEQDIARVPVDYRLGGMILEKSTGQFGYDRSVPFVDTNALNGRLANLKPVNRSEIRRIRV